MLDNSNISGWPCQAFFKIFLNFFIFRDKEIDWLAIIYRIEIACLPPGRRHNTLARSKRLTFWDIKKAQLNLSNWALSFISNLHSSLFTGSAPQSTQFL